ncbi:TRAP transporter substrate-binding protein [Treponema parvum]|uniref:TRAP transporter substrate-binding protein n=1 Tax=Treponema parvum TaxID=138851 RepID=A0A975EZG9_9SPIR|nr:TRAP transporter substrate-binding protein [Treponema parvum]QTQ11587.1 TRAP transporter substrate-binding protein [Treponema parvum]
MKRFTGKLMAVVCAVFFAISFNVFANGAEDSSGKGSRGVKTRTLTLSCHVTDNDSNMVLFKKFAELIEQKTGGVLKIDIYPNGQLYGQNNALEALKLGTLDFAMSDTSLWANYDAGCGLLDLPYMFKTRKQAINVCSSDIINPIKERLVKVAGIRPITVECLNFRNCLVKNMNVNSYAQFKNLKMRTPEAPTIVKFFELIGANPSVIASGEAYTAVQTGVVDGLEGHAEYMVLQKFYEVAKNYVQTEHVMTFTALNMSERVYQSLTDSQKTAMAEAAQEALKYFYEYTDKLFSEKYQELKDYGVKITMVDKTQFENAVRPYIEDFVKKYQEEDLYKKIQETK